ncbi:bleomycin resistance protein [Streptomyces sp. 796.1]|uniref:bleomycin resistance protein n=1 Tax=Streptomyces sp. 796.1 TaxID=3163029 RepID=UPI0039C91CA0
MTETTTPILPCRSIPETLAFYRALGFDVTFEQTRPNPYAVVQRGDIGLHFFGMSRYDPAASYSTCLINTDDVDGLHRAFRSGLKAAYGRVPTRGLPRIGPLRDTTYGVRQFLVTDPGGNCLRVGQPNGESLEHAPYPTGAFTRALHLAALLGDAKGDHRHAARVLDRALTEAGALELADGVGAPAPAGGVAAAVDGAAVAAPIPADGTGGAAPVGGAAADGGAAGVRPTPPQLFAALVLRADLALRLDRPDQAAALLDRAAGVPLAAAERAGAGDALRRAEELREALTEPPE